MGCPSSERGVERVRSNRRVRPLGLKRLSAWERMVAQEMEVQALGLRRLSKARGKAEATRQAPRATVRACLSSPEAARPG